MTASARTTAAVDRRWAAVLLEHRRAVDDFTARLVLVPDARWAMSREPGKWSPAEEALHVAQVYEVMLAEVDGGPGLRVRFPPWRAALFRHGVLPLLIALGRLPRNVRAPREVRPALAEAVGATPAQAAERVRRRAAMTEEVLGKAAERMRSDPRARTHVTHPYFGQLEPLEAMRLLSLHTKHHSRHLPPSRSPGPAAS